MQTLDRDEASTVVAARPDEVYALVADVTRTPERSPEVVSCRWRNRPVVTVADPGREFAFARTEPFAGTIVRRYRFEPVEGGTRVTESYEVARPVTRVGWFVIERIFRAGDRRVALQEGMRTTLERLRAEAGSLPG